MLDAKSKELLSFISENESLKKELFKGEKKITKAEQKADSLVDGQKAYAEKVKVVQKEMEVLKEKYNKCRKGRWW